MSKIQVLIGSTYKNRVSGGLYKVYHVDEGVRTPGSEAKVLPIVYLELWAKPFLSFTDSQLITVPATHLLRLFKYHQNPEGRFVVDDDYQ